MTRFRIVDTGAFGPSPRIVSGGMDRLESAADLARILEEIPAIRDMLDSGGLDEWRDWGGAEGEEDAGHDGPVLGGLFGGAQWDQFDDLVTGNPNRSGVADGDGHSTDPFGLGEPGSGFPPEADEYSTDSFGVEGPEFVSHGGGPARVVPGEVTPDWEELKQRAIDALYVLATVELLRSPGLLNATHQANLLVAWERTLSRFMRQHARAIERSPGPDAPTGAEAALAAKLLGRLGRSPILSWGTQFPSDAGRRINPGREPPGPGGGPQGPTPVIVTSPNDAVKVRRGVSAAQRAMAARRWEQLREFGPIGSPGGRPGSPAAAASLTALIGRLALD